MTSIWRIKRVKDHYYLYHRNEYIGPIEKIVSIWNLWKEWRRGRDSNPRGPHGPLALKASPLGRSGTPAIFVFIGKELYYLFSRFFYSH